MTRNTKEKVKHTNNANSSREKTVMVGLKSLPKEPISIKFDNGGNKSKEGISATSLVFAILGAVSLLISLIVYLVYIFPTNTPVVENISSHLSITYISPVYISEGDQITIDVSIVNLDPDQPFSGTVTLNFVDPTVPIMPIPDKNLSITVKNLQPSNRVTGQYKFSLPLGSTSENIEYYIQINNTDGIPYTNPDGTPYISGIGNFVVTDAPYTRTIFNWLIRGGGVAAILGFFGSIRKMLGLG